MVSKCAHFDNVHNVHIVHNVHNVRNVLIVHNVHNVRIVHNVHNVQNYLKSRCFVRGVLKKSKSITPERRPGRKL